jgi:hypothetical protein
VDQYRTVLEDGTYDALVVDATVDPAAADDVLALDLTILSGAHKGEVVSLRATGLHRDELDLLGLPGMIVVENGVPAFTVED